MSKPVRILLVFLLVDAVALGVYFLAKGMTSRSGEALTKDYAWTTVDESYQPAAELEQFIKADSEEKGLLPLQFRNYGQNAAVLKKFRGAKLVGAAVSVLDMTFKGLEDWAVVDIRIKAEDGRDIRRTILYVLLGGGWKVGDSGKLVD